MSIKDKVTIAFGALFFGLIAASFIYGLPSQMLYDRDTRMCSDYYEFMSGAYNKCYKIARFNQKKRTETILLPLWLICSGIAGRYIYLQFKKN